MYRSFYSPIPCCTIIMCDKLVVIHEVRWKNLSLYWKIIYLSISFSTLFLHLCVSVSDQQRRESSEELHGVAMQDHPVYGDPFIFFPNFTRPLKCLFSLQHHMRSHRTASTETSCDRTELLTKPEISTS